MTPQEFIQKWKPVALTERATAHTHFNDLCALFGHPTPIEDDPVGDHFAFEKGAPKTGGGEGWADVWKKGFFAWEYKKKKRDLDKAMEQLSRYAAGLENPPLHVACDTHIFRIETRWTNEAPATYEFELEELADPVNLDRLRAVFFDPDKLRSGRTRSKLTKDAADKFQTISDSLQHRNPDREAVAHFVNQLVFCFFADSVGLLPNGVWKKLLQTAERRPERAKQWLDQLFADMKDGGDFNLEQIAWFNGGLFDGRPALDLGHTEIGLLFAAASLDWSLIDPTIFGTLFERFLDPDKRAQIGAHYTDPEKIMMIVEPVVLRPLRAEWEAAKAKIEAIMAPALEAAGGNGKAASRELGKRFDAARARAEAERDAFIDRLCALRILDPACGSGNFLYLALQGVKDIEWRAVLDCETLGLGMIVPRVGPEILHGLEINPLAAELARTTIWIGDIQWRVKKAIHHHPSPLLRKLDSIECRDALLAPDGNGGFVEAEWPEADFIVGNPPFLGGKLMRRGLGDAAVEALFKTYDGHVSAEADLVCYWFAKAWEALEAKRAKRVGLVATNSIRGGPNRKVVEPIAATGAIFEAWSDEPWTVEGAAVRVSLLCFAGRSETASLNGLVVPAIHADLSAERSNLVTTLPQTENLGVAFMGDTKGGAFDIEGRLARAWLAEPLNPNGRPNSDVLSPWINGFDLTRRPRDMWIIDFGWSMGEGEATFYESPFAHVLEKVKPERDGNRRAAYRENWWRHVEPRPAMWAALAGEENRHGRARPGHPRKPAEGEPVDARFKAGHDAGSGFRRHIVTPTVAKHRLFVWTEPAVCPDHQLIAIARDDDTTFGILHSRFHEAWSLRLGTWLGVGNDPRYTRPRPSRLSPSPKA